MSKEQILVAAAQIFSQKGYHATSMQDIADAVELKKASLYHHIAKKQDILLILLDRALDLVIQQVSEAIAGEEPAPEKLSLAMRIYVDTLASHGDLSSVLLLEYRSLEPEQYGSHIKRRDRFEGIWRDLIQEGIDAGLYDCPDPALSARTLLGLLNWTIMWYSPQGSLSPIEIADQYADLLLHGLLIR
ncbi:MAG: TetR family transcriptional regulator [Anaerolineales bacterium]|nr:TetR/AcrR family transcriptional regulator [Chloroflexota bacterium]MBL6982370.1 TetR family transcriptional regulator [Anaerolineales bacterium]